MIKLYKNNGTKDVQLNSENNLLKSLRPLNIICSIFGLTTFQITKKGALSGQNKSYLIMSILAIIQISLQIYYLNYTYTHELYHENLLVWVMHVQHFTFRHLPTYYILFEFFNRKTVTKIFLDLQKCDTKLQCLLNNIVNNNSVQLIFWCFVMIILISSVLGIYLDFYIFYEVFYMKIVFEYIISYFLFKFTLPLFAVKFVIVNYLIEQRFRAINTILELNKYGEENVSIRLLYKQSILR